MTNDETTPNAASEAARVLGQMKSEKKTASSRKNGLKGGRKPGNPGNVYSEESRQRMAEAQRRRYAQEKASGTGRYKKKGEEE
jgi:hypothetical protein